MEIIIQDNKQISEIKSEFSEHYPYLKIEFFKERHNNAQASPIEAMIRTDKTIGEIRTLHTKGHLVISKNMKVGELEKEFQQKFGLPVQVFRKMGSLWIETINTDHWTLDEQNRHGASFKMD